MPMLLYRLTKRLIPRKPTLIVCTSPKYISQLTYSSSQSTVACQILIFLPIVMNNAYRVNDAFHLKKLFKPKKINPPFKMITIMYLLYYSSITCDLLAIPSLLYIYISHSHESTCTKTTFSYIKKEKQKEQNEQ